MDTSRQMLPEAELWTAVIVQAIKDLSSHEPGERRSASLWINSQSDAVHSFIWVCRITDIEPSFVRSALHRARQSELKRSA
jgi:hypothetical protein